MMFYNIHSWNNPLLHCDMLLHNWKLGFIAGSRCKDIGCVGMVSSSFFKYRLEYMLTHIPRTINYTLMALCIV